MSPHALRIFPLGSLSPIIPGRASKALPFPVSGDRNETAGDAAGGSLLNSQGSCDSFMLLSRLPEGLLRFSVLAYGS